MHLITVTYLLLGLSYLFKYRCTKAYEPEIALKALLNVNHLASWLRHLSWGNAFTSGCRCCWYLCNCLTNLDEILHADAYWPSEP